MHHFHGALLTSFLFTLGTVSSSMANQCDLPGLCDGTFIGTTIAEDKAACVIYCRDTPAASGTPLILPVKYVWLWKTALSWMSPRLTPLPEIRSDQSLPEIKLVYAKGF